MSYVNPVQYNKMHGNEFSEAYDFKVLRYCYKNSKLVPLHQYNFVCR